MIAMSCVKCKETMFEKDDRGEIMLGQSPKLLSDDGGMYYLCPSCKAKYRYIEMPPVNGQPKFSLEIEE